MEDTFQQELFGTEENVTLQERGEKRCGADAAMKELGHFVRMKRKSLAMTQKQLAEKAGMSRSEISCLERGMHATTGKRIIRSLAEAIGTDASRLLSIAGFQNDPGEEVMLVTGAFGRMSSDERRKALDLLTLVFPEAFRE